jgi:hypothetical protein
VSELESLIYVRCPPASPGLISDDNPPLQEYTTTPGLMIEMGSQISFFLFCFVLFFWSRLVLNCDLSLPSSCLEVRGREQVREI